MGKQLGLFNAATKEYRAFRTHLRLKMRAASLLIVGLLCLQTVAQENQKPPVEIPSNVSQWLFLKNGHSLRGKIKQLENGRIEVRTPSGSRLILAADTTAFIADSLEDAYWMRVARVKASDLAGQVRLFNWCINQNLLAQAQNQIDIAQELPSSRSDVATMAVTLEIASKRQMAIRNIEKANATRENARLVAAAETASLAQPHLAIRPLPAFPTAQTEMIRQLNVQPNMQLATAPIGQPNSLPGWNSSPPTIPGAQSNPQIGTVPSSTLSPIFNSGSGNALASTYRSTNSQYKPPPSNMVLDADGNLVAGSPVESASASTSEIAQVGYEEPLPNLLATVTTLATASKPNHAKVPAYQLDQETREMPKGTLGVFKRRIEPMLIRNCFQCHQAEDPTLPLMRLAAGRTVPRRMSQRNLHHLMRHVDKNNPLESPILEMTLGAHGGQDSASLSEGSLPAAYLRHWLVEVSHDPIKWRPFLILAQNQRQSSSNAQQTNAQQPNAPVKFDETVESSASAEPAVAPEVFYPKPGQIVKTRDLANSTPQLKPASKPKSQVGSKKALPETEIQSQNSTTLKLDSEKRQAIRPVIINSNDPFDPNAFNSAQASDETNKQ